jgi:peroxiredoxin Q/BCP
MSVVGKKIPSMQLDVFGGKSLDIPKDFAGKWTLLYIYPKDDTPGCTKQACGYRDNIGQFNKIGVQVYGLSGDDMKSHEAFSEKFDLNFPLISDKDKKLSTFLESYGEQEWQGKKSMGLSRDTFLIDPDGVIKKEWRKVSPAETVNTTYSETKQIVL